MPKLSAGNIYNFHYRRYKHDPYPMVLVLYCDDKLCHALNFHYLIENESDELIHMIAALATRSMKSRSMYTHYHNWMKRNIPGVIKNAYRTYKPNHITENKQITRGYWGVQTFVAELRKKTKPQQLTAVQKKLAEKLNKRKVEEIQGAQQAQEFDIKVMEPIINKFVKDVDALYSGARQEKEKLQKETQTPTQKRLSYNLNPGKARQDQKERDAKLGEKLDTTLNNGKFGKLGKKIDALSALIERARGKK